MAAFHCPFVLLFHDKLWILQAGLPLMRQSGEIPNKWLMEQLSSLEIWRSLLVNQNHDNPELRPGRRVTVLHGSFCFHQSRNPPKTPYKGVCPLVTYLLLKSKVNRGVIHKNLIKIITTRLLIAKLQDRGITCSLLTIRSLSSKTV